MSASTTDKGLLTPGNCAIVFIDHQPQLLPGVGNIDPDDLRNNALVLAKAAHMFCVPVLMTVVEREGFSGSVTPDLRQVFPAIEPIKRTSMNSWDCPEFVRGIKQSGRKNFLIAALGSETCLTFPALQMLEEGFGIYVVEDACGGVSQASHNAALRRIEQAGAVCVTAFQVLLEFQRDWSRREHYDEVMAVIKEHCGPHAAQHRKASFS